MLDNFEPSELKATAAVLKASHPHLLVEASGGITFATMPHYFSPHVDIISRGNLTQGYDVLDFSLKIVKGASTAAGVPVPKRRKKRNAPATEKLPVSGAYRCVKAPVTCKRAFHARSFRSALDARLPMFLLCSRLSTASRCGTTTQTAIWRPCP